MTQTQMMLNIFVWSSAASAAAILFTAFASGWTVANVRGMSLSMQAAAPPLGVGITPPACDMFALAGAVYSGMTISPSAAGAASPYSDMVAVVGR